MKLLNTESTMEQAQQIFARMTEIEKIAVRAANQGRLEYLADTTFRSDMPLLSFDERVLVLGEVKALLALETASKAHVKGFEGVTWKF